MDNFRRPSIDRPGPDTATQKDEYLQSPQIFVRNHSYVKTTHTPEQLKVTQTEATERVDNLQRPIDTLRTDEVEHRVEDAVLTPDNHLGSGSPIGGLQGSADHSGRDGNGEDLGIGGAQLESFGAAPAQQTYPFNNNGAGGDHEHETLW